MHTCITTLLFILVTLTSAIELNPFQILSRNKVQHQRRSSTPATSCLDRYTNYWDATSFNIFFTSRDEPAFNFTIVTKYMKFYPHTLNQWLEEYDFSIVNASTVPDKELCGWMGAGYVEADGHIRGTVGWRHNGLHPKIVVRDFGNSSSAKALPRAYVPPQPTLRPGDKTIDTATSILRQNAPDADVYYFMTLMLGAACLTLGFAILFYGLIIYFEMDRRTREAGKKSADIELDQIKVHNLSGSGMQRMDSDIDDDDANTPRVNIEITKSHTSNSTSVSGTGSVADPPPIYTVDGMGR